MQALDPLDQEQLGMLKQYWQSWGNVIMLAALTFILSYSGFKYWDYRQASRAEEAAALFEVVETQIQAKDQAAAEKGLQRLISEYPEAHDTAMAALQMARLQYEMNKSASATSLKTLEWVIVNGKEPWMRDWARLQSMELRYADKQYDKVIDLADRRETTAATSAMMELKGDALMQMNNRAAAKTAYEQAQKADAVVQPFEGNTPRHLNNPILKMKLQSISSRSE